jgi:ribosomal protein S18 acetylase RimI-like enzyme
MDERLVFRVAGPADGGALWALLEPVFRAGETYALPREIGREAALAYWQAPGRRTLLAEGAGGLLGSYSLGPNAGGGGAHVANAAFVTAAAARGRGVARRMLEHALAAARDAGFAAMQFNFVVETNAAAVHLWRSAGFAEVGRLPGAFRHPRLGEVDALVFHRWL